MLSTSYEKLQRSDEGTVCSSISQTAQYRAERDIADEIDTPKPESMKDEVETLTPQEL